MSEVEYTASAWGRIFHSLQTHEALGAGSAGPGKSLVLLMDPMEQVALEHNRCLEKKHPYHLQWGNSSAWAIHFRRTMPMLEHSMKRAEKFFPRIDSKATFDKQKHTWRFSSGMHYQFAHCAESNDYEGYQSSEYCVAGGTRIVMGDGSLKEIQDIVAGEMVTTLEGPKRVLATWDSGVRPCCEVAVLDQGEIVGTQIQPTTHPVLCATSDESQTEPSPRRRQGEQRCRPHGYVWQDYESLLCGLPESPVKRVSRVDAETGFAMSDGSRLEETRLPALSVRAVLHEPTLLRHWQRTQTSTQSSEHRALPARSKSKQREPSPRLLTRLLGRQLEEAIAEQESGRNEGSFACGGACAPLVTGTAIGSMASCSACRCLRGAQPLRQSGTGIDDALPQAGAEQHILPCCSEDEAGRTPSRSRCTASFYPHFYSGECRARSEGVRTQDAEVRFAGWFQTFDLTVEGANHYVTEIGIVNAQTHLAFDELVQFEKDQYDNLTTRVRSSDPMLRHMLKIRAASNPFFRREAGVNLAIKDPHWVRKRFVDPAPKGGVVLEHPLKMRDGRTEIRTRIYLPATLYDNPDPEFVRQYEATLMGKPKHIRQAMLYGDWYVNPGSYYGDDWIRDTHTCAPFRIPADWRCFRSMDWGFKSWGTVGWYAIDYDGNLIKFREFPFRLMEPKRVAKRIMEIEKPLGFWRNGQSLITGPADTQLWEERGDSGVTKAKEFAQAGVGWLKANKRSRARNAQLLLTRLQDRRGQVPGILFFETCERTIMTLPAIQSDKDDPESPAEGGDDHWHDETLYACAHAANDNAGTSRASVMESAEREDADEDPDIDISISRGRLGYGSRVE